MTMDELDRLYQRAVTDPVSLTRAEKNKVRGWPAPEEEDRLFVAKTGGTRAQLIAKAINHPDELTRYETDVFLFLQGITLEQDHPRPTPRWETTPLQRSAMNALLAVEPEEKQAVVAATHRRLALGKARIEESDKLRREHERQRRLEIGTPWIQAMLDNGLLSDGRDCWGFVCFRTGYGGECEDAWARFQDYFVKTGERVVKEWYSGELIWPTFKVIWVSDKTLNGASTDTLRNRFKEMGEAGELPAGIRTNCFLVADEPAIKSDASKTPYRPDCWVQMEMRGPDWPTIYMRAVHPAPNAVQMEGEMAGFTGEVTIALPKVFDYLHCACFSEQYPTDWLDDKVRRGGWCDVYKATKNPARWKLISGVSGGVSY